MEKANMKACRGCKPGLLGCLMVLLLTRICHALQGGPVMPEYVQFEPADVTDIVNLNTGDFTYSLPLGEIPGPAGAYPLNISYHAGIGHDQEATWVGLGWSLNPGAINRSMRSYPDDISNGISTSYAYIRETQSGWSVLVGAGWGPCGLNMTVDNNGNVGGGVSLGYKAAGGAIGMGVDINFDGSVGLSATAGYAKLSVSNKGVGVGLVGGSAGALSATGSMGLHMSWSGDFRTDMGVGLTLGGSDENSVWETGSKRFPGGGRASIFSISSNSRGGGGVSIAGTGFASQSSALKGGIQTSSEVSGFGLVVPLPKGFWAEVGFSHYTNELWLSNATVEYPRGYIYQAGDAVRAKSIVEPGAALPKRGGNEYFSEKMIDFEWKDLGASLEVLDLNEAAKAPMSREAPILDGVYDFQGLSQEKKVRNRYWATIPSYDVFLVAGQGISGAVRAYPEGVVEMSQVIFEDLEQNQFLKRPSEFDDESGVFINEEQTHWVFEYDGFTSRDGDVDFQKLEYDYRFCSDLVVDGSTEKESFHIKGSDFDALFNGDPDNYNRLNSLLARGCSPYAIMKSNIKNERNRLVFSDDQRDRYRAPAHTRMHFGFINENGLKGAAAFPGIGGSGDFTDADTSYRQFGGGRQVIPLLENGSPNGRLSGFKIVEADGKQYFFEQPVQSLLQVDYTTNQAFGSPSFLKSDDEKRFSWAVQPVPYATQWLISEIRGADFINIGNKMEDNYGYQVKFKYTRPSRYTWRMPYAPPLTALSKVPNLKLGEKDKYIASFGQKELIYLQSIETATHKAVFNLNDMTDSERKDSKEWRTSWLEDGVATNSILELPISLVYKRKDANSRYLREIEPESGMKPFGETWNSGFDHKWYVYGPEYVLDYIYLPYIPSRTQQNALLSNEFEVSNFNVQFAWEKSNDNPKVEPGPKFVSPAKNYRIVLSEPAPSGDKIGPWRLKVEGTQTLTAQYMLHEFQAEDDRANGLNQEKFNGRVIVSVRPFVESDNGKIRDLYVVETVPRMNLLPLYVNKNVRNPARFLNSIDIVDKASGNLQRAFEFTYDYSLCPKTPNSFSGTADYVSNPDDLEGKLTLLKISETGVDLLSGEKFYLPAWEFRYQDSNPPYYYWASRTGSWDYKNDNLFFNEIAAAAQQVDMWGMHNHLATEKNRKLAQNASSGVNWNLARIDNPMGARLYVEYERDTYLGEDYAWFNGSKGVAFHIQGTPEELPSEDNVKLTLAPDRGAENSCVYLGGECGEEYEPDIYARWDFPSEIPDDWESGDDVFLVIGFEPGWKGWNAAGFCSLDRIHRWVWKAFPAKIHSLVNSTQLTLNLSSGDLPTKAELWNFIEKEIEIPSRDECDIHSYPRFAGLFKKSKKILPGGDLRVKSLKSCFLDCRETRYGYDLGAVPVVPEPALSLHWLRDNRYMNLDNGSDVGFMPFDGYHSGAFGRNLLPTPGGDFDIPLLPSGPVTYGAVTTENVDGSGASRNGKTVYRFWNVLDDRHLPFQSHTDLVKIANTFQNDAPWVYGFDRIFDHSAILGNLKSVTRYGTNAAGQFYMIDKDSSEYTLDQPQHDYWVSEKSDCTGCAPAVSYIRQSTEHIRYPVRQKSQLHYNFVRKTPGEEDADDVDHILTRLDFGQPDQLTGIPKVTKATYREADYSGSGGGAVREKTTRVATMADLAGFGDDYLLPKEMKRRNMLTQPYLETVEIGTAGNTSPDSILDVKLTRWDVSNSPKPGWAGRQFYRKGDMIPKFNPNGNDGVNLGNPAWYYGSGMDLGSEYDLSKWHGGTVLSIDKYSHPIETISPEGILSTSVYSNDGINRTGFILNAAKRNSGAVTLNHQPETNSDWTYQNGSEFRKGNFYLHNGGVAPVISRSVPISPGETYTISFRAKSRAASSGLNVDFYTAYKRVREFCFLWVCIPIGEETVTAEGPQSNFNITTSWAEYSATFNVTPATYEMDELDLENPYARNVVRFFNEASSSAGDDRDVIIDFVKIVRNPGPPTVSRFGDWTLAHGAYSFVSNQASIFSSSSGMSSVLSVPLDLNNPANADIFTVELKARANGSSVPLSVDFYCGSGCEGDQVSLNVGETWKKFKVGLDRRAYPSATSYAGNMLRLFSDSYLGGEIELQYVRVYPEGAMANSVRFDGKGKVIEMVDENNNSKYYEYNTHGNLIGIRNDKGEIVSEQVLHSGK